VHTLFYLALALMMGVLTANRRTLLGVSLGALLGGTMIVQRLPETFIGLPESGSLRQPLNGLLIWLDSLGQERSLDHLFAEKAAGLTLCCVAVHSCHIDGLQRRLDEPEQKEDQHEQRDHQRKSRG
jgi:hypothetical protein